MQPEESLMALYDRVMSEEVPSLRAMTKDEFEDMQWQRKGKMNCISSVESQYETDRGYQTVIDRFNIPMRWSKIRSLRLTSQGVYSLLNDEIINFYMCLLQDKSKDCHFFNSFFIDRLENQGYQQVEKWSRSNKLPKGKKSIFDLDKIFIPINLVNIHWALIVVFVQSQKVRLNCLLFACCMLTVSHLVDVLPSYRLSTLTHWEKIER